MLRVALTGSLGAGKSTAARFFAALGAHILSSDEIGRELMQPGQPVYAEIVRHFGPAVELPHPGGLNRTELARIAFAEGRVEELNAIVHPAVIAHQAALADQIAIHEPNAVIIVESALVFETRHAGDEGWRRRFDKVILVTAPEEQKIARFIARSQPTSSDAITARAALEIEARRRLAQQIPDSQKAALSDYVLTNDASPAELEEQVRRLWPQLQAMAASDKTL